MSERQGETSQVRRVRCQMNSHARQHVGMSACACTYTNTCAHDNQTKQFSISQKEDQRTNETGRL